MAEVAKNSYGRDCIPSHKAAIYGLIPGMGVGSIFNLPPTVSTEANASEDDGGFYAISIFRYPGFEVHIVRDQIDIVTSDSAELKWVGGIKMGMQKSAVNAIIGKAMVGEGAEKEHYLTCVEDADVYAILHYKANLLIRIELVMDRP